METIITNFSYLIRITIGAKNINMIVKNKKQVPDKLLETMANERINKYINETFKTQKHYRSQTHEQYLTRMLKQSSFEIENLNEMEVFDLQLQFNMNETIINIDNGKTEKRQSKFNETVLP